MCYLNFFPGQGSLPIDQQRRVETQTRDRLLVSGLLAPAVSPTIVVRHAEHSSLAERAGVMHG